MGNIGSVATLPVLAKKDLVLLIINAFGISEPERQPIPKKKTSSLGTQKVLA